MVTNPTIYDTPEWENLSTSARYIYLYLLTRADNVTGKTFPSLQTIVKDLKMSKNTFIEHVPEIEKAGLMVKEKRAGIGCIYTMLPVPKEVVPKEVVPKQTCTTPYIGTAPLPKQGHIHINNISITDNICSLPFDESKNQKKQKDDKLTEVIEDIYQEYPRKVARGQALKAIKTALKKIGADTLLDAVRKYAASVQGKDVQFIPYPATWFNGERWNDETPVAPIEEKHEPQPLYLQNRLN